MRIRYDFLPRHTSPFIKTSLSIRGLGALSALGENLSDHHHAILAGAFPFRPIGELMDHSDPLLPAAWIQRRELLTHRKWSPASMAALHVARQAIAQSGWSPTELAEAVLILGTSRGGAAGWLQPWPGRRAFPLMAASNAMHGEAAAAISIELGIKGAYQVISTGCSAGLDAMGVAAMHLQCGIAPRALVVAVDLPMVKILLDGYAATGILSKDGRNDPYHPETSGIFPAECAAALTLESGEQPGVPRMIGFLANSDASDPLALDADCGQLTALLNRAVAMFGAPAALCPHATGTASHGKAETSVLSQAFPQEKPSLHLLKPYLGHGIGAGALLEAVVLTEFLRHQQFPPNLSGLFCPQNFQKHEIAQTATGPVYKIAASLGGHNSLIVLQ